MEQSIARVAVSSAVYHIDKPFDYLVPDEMAGVAAAGMRVLVPFGRGSKIVEGIILSLTDKSGFKELKAISSLPDDKPVLDEDSLKLALWMSDRFFCSVYDALRAMLPTKLDFKNKLVTSRDDSQADSLDSLNAGSLDAPQASSFLLRDLELTTEQSTVFDEILPLLESDSPKAALLCGVTGSGKTHVYIKLIEKALALGKTAIVLVPEIGLTPQTAFIFESHFGDTVAVLHSALGDKERYLRWLQIREGKINVVVGTRSAVFAPLKNIGLIVIDEEQEHTYKSEGTPRYHAHLIAKYRVTSSSGLLLLASATPSIDSMYMALSGKYSLHRLEKRFNDMMLPSVIIVDMKKELKAGNGGSISLLLRDELSKNINSGEQSILFINRRGASPVVACGECGYTFKCRNCSVSMTYHTSNKRLLCHYCGYSIAAVSECPQCQGKLKYIGAGTQKVESELSDLFPGVSIIRMDGDTTTKKDSHSRLLSGFRNNEAHILLGTQMVTKGLDFENVTLVGVISADLSLYTSDYRANERTFSLITQVVGRSGRGEKPGRAVIQSYTPQNKVISLASKQDFDTFYNNEIEIRKILKCPPVRDLISLTVTGKEESNVISSCDYLMRLLKVTFNNETATHLLGPAPANVSKVMSKYVYKILVVCKNTKSIRAKIKQVISEFALSKKSRGLTFYADIDVG